MSPAPRAVTGPGPAPGPGAVVVVGDVLVDVVAVPDGPLHPGSDTPSSIVVTGGGSAANTACWLAAAGLPVRLVAAVGRDAFGSVARADLAAAGVAFDGWQDPERPTGACVVLVDGAGERTMLPDRGANGALPPRVVLDAVAGAADDGAAWVHLSGYTLLGEGSRPAGLAAIADVRARGLPWSVDAASAAPLTAAGPSSFLGWVQGCDVLFGNDDELAALGGLDTVLAAVGEVVAKHGPAGATWSDGHHVASVTARPVVVVDAVGAGDAFDAGFLAARVRGDDPQVCLARGVDLAARAVGQRGARP